MNNAIDRAVTWLRIPSMMIFLVTVSLNSQAFVLRLSNADFVTTASFSNVTRFDIRINVDETLVAGVFDNPVLRNVVYSVSGVLEPGTPSEFPSFDLQRSIDGAEFYAQGSALRFEIAADADLGDGLQADELVANANGELFVFDGREVDNGRFHPAILRLNEDGSGSIRNSNNVPTLEPLLEVEPGSEYITGLMYDPGNLTLYRRSSGGGAVGILSLLALLLAGVTRVSRTSSILGRARR